MAQEKGLKSKSRKLKKQMIIDTAVNVFYQKGYHAATLEDIAHELDLTRPAIYHYFSSKEELLSQIYLQGVEHFYNNISEIADMDLTPREKLRAFVSRHLNSVMAEKLPIFTLIFNQENHFSLKDFKKILKLTRNFTIVLENIIIEGMEQGYFHQVNSRLQASAIIGMCNWVYYWYKFGKGLFEPDEIVYQFTSLIENGLMQENIKSENLDIVEPPEVHGTQRRTKNQILKDLKACTTKMAKLMDELEKIP